MKIKIKKRKNVKISIPESVLVQNLEDESVLLNLDSEQYFGLDDVGTSMWEGLKETESVETAYEKLLKMYEVEPEQLRQDLDNLVKKLQEHGLVEIIQG